MWNLQSYRNSNKQKFLICSKKPKEHNCGLKEWKKELDTRESIERNFGPGRFGGIKGFFVFSH